MITKDERDALEAVTDGADVFSYKTARILRKCEKKGLVLICKSQGDYPGEGRLPYFGAITTVKGKKELSQPSV